MAIYYKTRGKNFSTAKEACKASKGQTVIKVMIDASGDRVKIVEKVL